MPALIEEILLVLSYSRRTRWALWAGTLAFAAILLIGTYLASHVSFQGVLAPLTEPFRQLVLEYYEIAAWIVLARFLALTVKNYLKDRKRMFC